MLGRKLKSQHCIREFHRQRRNPRAQWKILNLLSGRVASKRPLKVSVTELNDTFASIVHDPSRPDVLPLHTPASSGPKLEHFEPVSIAVVEDLLQSINVGKAAGADEVTPCLLKSCRQTIALVLTNLINQPLREGTVPCNFKHAHVCPVPKSGDPTVCNNYRPVSLLPIVSKILEKVVHRQVLQFFKNNPDLEALPPEQFAYRNFHSCEDALTVTVGKWRRAIDGNKVCGVVFADMMKAFDNVRHAKLVEELSQVGLGKTVLKWFANYLSSRTQQVVCGTERSNLRNCSKGVPQGSVLGPLLFCIYVRKVSRVFKHSLSQLYADDIAFYVIGVNAAEIQRKLQEDMTLLEEFLDERCLVLNPSKTQLLLICRSTVSPPHQMSIVCKGDPHFPCRICQVFRHCNRFSPDIH